MDIRTALILGAVVLVAGAVGVAAVPGALDDPRVDDPPDRPSHLSVGDVVVEPNEVGGATADLDMKLDLEHRGGAAENVTVRYRAIDDTSGLLVDETTVPVGDIEPESTDPTDRERPTEHTVNGSLAVDREGGYQLEAVVYEDGTRQTTQSTSVSGVSALTPSYADSHVGFTDGDIWPTVSVSVREADDGTATLSTSAAVTNGGDERSENLELRVLVRQADSNVVADDATETVQAIRPGRTATVDTTVDVPDGYNYYIDVALWDDDVLIDETQSVANLDPQETIDANETVESVEFAVEDFAEDDVADDAADVVEDEPVDDVEDVEDEDAPGFGVFAAVLALVVAALYARRLV
ncbi:DUF7490 domain-containing protein [Halorubrum vacuolatum]|uniref:PGF-CTERM protein n=1 Tax=Halorubrum vacuolatum TaxID=63740 RepID=A0A238UMX0_HALVU|nr:PGF-CTERM sorting domain-containing protein [Halorubrum vacuolatum]SNR23388.1 PGF-CTERM protein [Halorubrum vacuolatum]